MDGQIANSYDGIIEGSRLSDREVEALRANIRIGSFGTCADRAMIALCLITPYIDAANIVDVPEPAR